MGDKKRLRYLTIFEDGTMSVMDALPQEIFGACEDGIYDIVDMETGEQWTSKGWVKILIT